MFKRNGYLRFYNVRVGTGICGLNTYNWRVNSRKIANP